MLVEKGVVVAVEKEQVWVQTEVKTTCGSCQAKDNCATSSIAKAFSSKPNVLAISSTLNLSIGDEVVLGVDEGFVVKTAVYVYLLPIFGFFLLAFVAQLIVVADGQFAELIRFLIAAFGGWLGFLLARKALKSPSCTQQQNVAIVKKLGRQIPVDVK